MREHGVRESGLEQEQVAGAYEHGNRLKSSIESGKSFSS
jgi:hypothetical protein